MAEAICSVADCVRSALCRGWCNTHYERWRRTGDVQSDVPIGIQSQPYDPGQTCAVDGCRRPVRTQGWCSTHYGRWLRHGDVAPKAPIKEQWRRPADGLCTVDGCSKPASGRTWCAMHYTRWKRTGTVEPGPLAPGSLEQRFWRYVQADIPEQSCWPWQGGKHSGGYGSIRASGRALYAHRVSYELHVGPIPVGLQIDHLCRNRACVNPTHLEPVTLAVNIGRGLYATKTHCPAGHPYNEANTYRGRKGRVCKTCRRERERERKRMKRGAA